MSAIAPSTVLVLPALIAITASVGTAQPTTWDQSTDFWSNPARWSGGVVPLDASQTPVLPGSSPYTVFLDVSPAALAGLELLNPNATLQLFGNATLPLPQSTHNDGVVLLDTAGSSTFKEVTAPQSATLNGSGSIRLLGNNGRALLSTADGVVLTNGPDHTIAGYGWITADIRNLGRIRADVSTDPLRIREGRIDNESELSADLGELLIERNAHIVQTPDARIRSSQRSVRLENARVEGGSLNSGVVGFWQVSNGVTTLNAVQIGGVGLVNADATLELVDPPPPTGSLTIGTAQPPQPAILAVSGTLSITPGFQLALVGGSPVRAMNPDASLRFEQGSQYTGRADFDIPVTNHGALQAGGPLIFRRPVTNHGTITGGTASSQGITFHAPVVQSSTGLIVNQTRGVNIVAGIQGGAIQSQSLILVPNQATATIRDVQFQTPVLFGVSSSQSFLRFENGLHTDHTVTLRATTSGSGFHFAHPAQLTGAGSLLIGNGSNSIPITSDPGQPITIQPPFVLRGRARVDAPVVNNSLISAEPVENQIGDLIFMQPVINNSTITARDECRVSFYQLEQSANASVVTTTGVIGVWNVRGGRIEVGPQATGGVGEVLDSVTLIGRFGTAGGFEVANTLDLQGEIYAQSSSPDIDFQPGAVLAGGGIVRSSSGQEDGWNLNGDTYTQAHGNTLIGGLNIRGTFTNHGTLHVTRRINANTIYQPGSHLILAPDSHLILDAESPTRVARFAHDGRATLGGTLTVAALQPLPARRWSVDLFSPLGGVDGSFDAVSFPEPPFGFRYLLTQTPQRLTLRSVCRADLNLDSRLDIFDIYQMFLAITDQTPEADFNQDGQINFFDFALFLNMFNVGCP
jgi:hypothetical protein